MAKEKGAMQRPRVIAHVSDATRGQLLVEPAAYSEFQQQWLLNDRATHAGELYPRTFKCSRCVLKCPSQQSRRVSLLRAALGYAHRKQTGRGSVGPVDEGPEELRVQRRAKSMSASFPH
jgi:hypothetical protein